MSPSPRFAAPSSFGTDTPNLGAPDSRYDLGTAYSSTDASVTRFKQALDELAEHVDALIVNKRENPNGIDAGHELNVSESAKRVQQWLLGDQRRPEPTNAYTELTHDNPNATRAINALQDAAGRFAKREQTLLVLSNTARLDQNALTELQLSIDALRETVPALATDKQDNTADLVAILSTLDSQSGERYFGPALQQLEALPTNAATPTDLAYQIALDDQAVQPLNSAQDNLKATAALLSLIKQIDALPKGEAQHQFAVTGLDALTRKDQGLSLADDGDRTSAIILPGTAGGEAATAAGALITSNIEQELAQATSLKALAEEPRLVEYLQNFAAQRAKLTQKITQTLAEHTDLAETRDADDNVVITRSERGQLNRMIAARDTAQQWLADAVASQTMPAGHEAMIVAAREPAPAVKLVEAGFRDALKDGYRGSNDWNDATAKAAMDIEIASRARALDGDQALDLTRLDDTALQAAANRVVSKDTVAALKDKAIVDDMIVRFPDTAAKLDDALADNLDRPDFKAMGVTLPEPAPEAPTPAPRLILGR